MPGSGRLDPGSAISATPASPSNSPASRPQPKRSVPSASAMGKAISGTAEIRIDMIPDGRRATEM